MVKHSSSHHPSKSTKHHPKAGAGKSGGASDSGNSGNPSASDPTSPQPVFAQPTPSPDPTGFKNPVTDQSYSEIASVEAVPEPADGAVEVLEDLAREYADGIDRGGRLLELVRHLVSGLPSGMYR